MLLLFYFFFFRLQNIFANLLFASSLLKKTINYCLCVRTNWNKTKRKRNPPKNCLLKIVTPTRTWNTKHQTFRYIQSQTDTKMWLRYYLEQLFGVRWRKYNQRYTSRRKKYPSTEHNEPNVRFYKATATTDYSDCDCIDI